MKTRSEDMETRIEELLDIMRVPPGKKIDLKKDYDPDFTGKWVQHLLFANHENNRHLLVLALKMLSSTQKVVLLLKKTLFLDQVYI